MLKTEIHDQILVARLADGATNAISLDTLQGLHEAVKQVNSTPELKGVILTGEGRFFSSGFHLPMLIDFKTSDDVIGFFAKEEKILVDFFMCDKPVVSVINGHCAAMGLILAMASDYRLAKNHPKIKLGMSEIHIGLALSVAQSAVMQFGLESARTYRDVMYFGEMIGVDKAKALNMIDEVAESEDDLMNRAKEIISRWIDTPNRPFIPLKKGLREKVARDILSDLETQNWQKPLADIVNKTVVKETLAFVQAAMEAKKS